MTIVGWLPHHAARNAGCLLDSPSPRCAQGTVVVVIEGSLVAFVVVRRASRLLACSSCPFTPCRHLSHVTVQSMMHEPWTLSTFLAPCILFHLVLISSSHLRISIHAYIPSVPTIYHPPSAISICTHRYHMHICFMPHTLLVPLSMPLTIYDLSRSAHDRTLDYVVDVRVVFSPCCRQLARLLACLRLLRRPGCYLLLAACYMCTGILV